MEKIFDTEKKLNKFGIVLGYEKEYCSEDCKADGCMMWRWNDPSIKNEGYCGLAGKECAE